MASAVPTLLGKNSPAGTATSVAVTLTRAQDAGTILIVDAGVAALAGTASATCADNRSVGNSYHADCIVNNSNRPLAVFSCKPGTLLQSGDIVTVSNLVSGSSRFIAVYQVTNLDQTTWLNGTAGNPKTANATSASPNSGTLTLAAGSYWLFGVLASANAAAATAGGDNQSGTYAILDQGGNLAAEHENVTPGSSLAYQAAFAQTSTASCTAMVVYNIAAGGTTFTQAISPTAGATLALQKTVLKPIGPAAGVTLSLTKTVVQTARSCAAGATLSLATLKSKAVTIAASAGATMTLTRTVGKNVTASAGATLNLAKTTAKTIVAAAAAMLTLRKTVAKTVSAAAGCAATVTRTTGKAITATAAATVTLTKTMTKTVSAAAAATLVLTKTVAKTISVSAAATATVTKTVGKTIQASAGSLLSLLARFVSGSTGAPTTARFDPPAPGAARLGGNVTASVFDTPDPTGGTYGSQPGAGVYDPANPGEETL